MANKKRTKSADAAKKHIQSWKKAKKDVVPSSYQTRYIFNPRANGPLPATMKVDMFYAQSSSINPALASSGGLVLRANGLFDPEVAAGGHQPRGFDQLMALYDHFVVINAKITVWFANQSSSPNGQSLATVSVRDNSTIVTNALDVMENRVNSSKILGIATGCHTDVIELDVNPNKFLGRSKPLSDPDLKGSATSDPTEQCFFHINVTPVDASQDIGSTAFWYRIDYTAVLIEPKQPIQS